jgi:hypothetical protein
MAVSVLGWLVVALLVAGVTGGGLLWFLGWPRLPSAGQFDVAQVLDLLKIALSVVARFGGVVLDVLADGLPLLALEIEGVLVTGDPVQWLLQEGADCVLDTVTVADTGGNPRTYPWPNNELRGGTSLPGHYLTS